MTTVCYRDGVLAADSRAYSGDKSPIGTKVKLRRLKDGTLIGCSTTEVGGGERVLDWYEEGAKRDAELPEGFQLLVAKANGDVFIAVNKPQFTGPLNAKFFAIGSGEQFAYGAMAAGASAMDAVFIACQSDIWSGLPVRAIRHDTTEVQVLER